MGRCCQALALVAALAAVAAGCASGPGSYSLGKTRKCLEKKGLAPRRVPASDFVASTASGGAFAVKLPSNAATLAFGKDSQEASALAAGYRRGGAFATVETDRNVALVWTTTPSKAQEDEVSGCLA